MGDLETDLANDFYCDLELSLWILLSFCFRTLENYIYWEIGWWFWCVAGMLGVKWALVWGVLAELFYAFLFYWSLFWLFPYRLCRMVVLE